MLGRKAKLIVTLIFLLDLIGLGAGTAYAINNATKTARLDILIAPSSATITIDNTTYSSNGSFNLHPGTYTASIQSPGFETKSVTLELNDHETTRLYNFLLSSDSGLKYYETNQDDFLILKQVGASDPDVIAFVDSYNQKLSIKNFLPITFYQDALFNEDVISLFINGGSYTDCPTSFCIAISDAHGNGYEKALDLIKETGFNPNDYQILYEKGTINYLNENSR